jgi:hypothetical protein
MTGREQHVPSVHPVPIKRWQATCSCGWRDPYDHHKKDLAQQQATHHWKVASK